MNHFEESQQDTQNHVVLSRRSFLRAGLGVGATLTSLLLPSVPGGFASPFGAEDAQAAEETRTIVIASKKNVGFVAVEVADNVRTPVAGMRIVVTSRYGACLSAEGVTNDQGIALVDVSALSEGADKTTDALDSYAFNGSIQATKDGYRIFKTGLARIEGGTALAIPARTLEPGKPYAPLLTFDEWDAQYADSTFITTTKNDIDHVLALELEGVEDGDARAYLYQTRSDTPLAEMTLSCSGGHGSGSVCKKLLLEKGPDALSTGKDYRCRVETSSTSFSFPISLGVEAGAAESVTTNDGSSGLDLLKYGNVMGDTVMQCPKSIPVIGGSTLELELPRFPFIFNISPAGYLMLGLTFPKLNYQCDNGEVKPDRWCDLPRKTIHHQWVNQKQNYIDSIDKWKGVRNNGSTDKCKQVEFMKSFTLSIDFTAMIHAQWEWGSHKWIGAATGMVRVLGSASFTEQFAVGFVPLFIQLRFDALAAASLNAGMSMEGLDFSTFSFEWGQLGVAVNIQVEGSLTLGVGISGAISAGVRGSIGASVFLGFTGDMPKHDDAPHLVYGMSASVAIVVQAFLFKWNKKLVDKDWPDLYDNWGVIDGKTNGTDSSDEGVDLNSSFPFAFGTATDGSPIFCADGSGSQTNGTDLSFIPDDAVMVSVEELAETAESKAVAGPVSNGVADWTVTAQDEDLVTYALDDIVAVDGFTYSDVGIPSNDTVGHARVKDVSDDGGIIPSVDVKIATGFSDPRVHVVTVDDRKVLFRIVSVTYPTASGEVARSRLATQVLDENVWTSPKVIEYDSGLADVSRVDLFDYDFDVAVYGTDIGVAVVSGTRTSADGTDFSTVAEVCTNPVMTYLRLGSDLVVKQRRTWRSSDGASASDGFHTFMCPRIVSAVSSPATTVDSGSPLFLIGYVHRSASAAADVMTVSASVMFEALIVTDGSMSFSKSASADRVLDSSTYDLLIYLRSDNVFEMVAVSAKGLAPFIAAFINGSFGVSRRSYGFPYQVGGVCAWPHHEGFLFSYDGNLYGGTLGDSKLGMRRLNPENSRIDAFAIDDSGLFLYYSDNSVGKVGQTYDTSLKRTDISRQRFRIMAARYVPKSDVDDEGFTHPFPLAVLPHAADALACLAQAGSACAFVVTSITDMSKSVADLYYVDVPKVTCATVIDFDCIDSVVCAGDKAAFDVSVRNDGNQRLAGFTFSLYDGDSTSSTNTAVSVVKLDFSSDNVQRSDWEYLHGVPTNDADPTDGSFEPGDVCVCRVKFDIPASWSGTKNVRVGAESDAPLATSMTAQSNETLAPQDEEEDPELLESIIEHLMMYQDCPSDGLEILSSDTADLTSLSDAPVTIERTSGGSGTSATSVVSGASGSLGSSEQRLPDTGDATSGLVTPASLALGALAAGFAAYSARRVELERGDEEE